MPDRIELKPNRTIPFIGDSITDAGRLEPAYRPFGYGYVHFVAYRLKARYPEYNLDIINTGISGDTIRDLNDRWENDCLNHKPDILSVLIGINDVFRQYTGSLDTAVLLDEYQLTYKRLLSLVKEKYNCRLILMTWFILTCGHMHGSRSAGSKQQNYNLHSGPGNFVKMKNFFSS